MLSPSLSDLLNNKRKTIYAVFAIYIRVKLITSLIKIQYRDNKEYLNNLPDIPKYIGQLDSYPIGKQFKEAMRKEVC